MSVPFHSALRWLVLFALALAGTVALGTSVVAQSPAPRPAPGPSASQGKDSAQPSPDKKTSPGSAKALPPPQTAVILPFVSLRKPEDAWIGAYLADMLRQRIASSGKLALVSQDAAAQHAAFLALDPLAAPSPNQFAELGLDYVIVGTVQRVLDRVAVKVRVLARTGSSDRQASLSWIVQTGSDTPEAATASFVADAARALDLPESPPKPAYPDRWEAVEAVYRLEARVDVAADADARTALLGELQAYAKEPGLAGQVAAMEALLRLQNALSLVPGEQSPELNRAAQAAHAAVAAAPEDAERRALLAEILYFAKQDYVSKTEASVARLKNPLSGLAWAVLGLLAGPSTGEGTQQLMRARQADPFLWQSARAPGTPPFQGGILETTLRRWAVQHDQSGREKPLLDKAEREENQTMREGIAAFEAKQWDAAISAFQKAADQDEYDYRPLLYQARILIETGRSPEALGPLRDLQAENPLENEVLLYLGVALEKTGNLEEARQSFLRILQDDPQQPVALYHAGLTAMAAKAWPAALEPLRTLVGIQPRHEDAWLQLGIAQANLEQWTGADDAFKQVLTLNPKSQAAREWRARIRSKLSR